MSFLWFLSQYRSNAGNTFFLLITSLGQEIFTAAVLCWLYWCVNKKHAYILGFSYFASGLLVQGLKITFRIPRPWGLDPDFQAVEKAVPNATGYSFPSGHTQSITALLGTLSLMLKKKPLKVLCFVVIFLVGFSRMYLGVHTPLDVSVGFAVTLICVLLFWYIFNKKEVVWEKPVLISICLLAASLLLMIYALVLYKSDAIEFNYVQDCFKASGAGVAFAAGYYCDNTQIRFREASGWKQRILRFSIGIVVTILLLEGLKPLIGASLQACFVRYFLAMIWVTAVYPALFVRFGKGGRS